MQSMEWLWQAYRGALYDAGADDKDEDGLLGTSVGQDAKYAVSAEVRKAAQALLDAGVSADAW